MKNYILVEEVRTMTYKSLFKIPIDNDFNLPDISPSSMSDYLEQLTGHSDSRIIHRTDRAVDQGSIFSVFNIVKEDNL